MVDRGEAAHVDDIDLDSIRTELVEHLESQGFTVNESRISFAGAADKVALRGLHATAVSERLSKARGSLESFEEACLARMIAGDQVDPAVIRPVLHLVDNKNSFESRLWRWAALHWSIPTSLGYGRRLRYLVFDAAHHNALVGVIGLQDPVFSLGCRDSWVGWTPERRSERLTDVMDCFVLGAVPPYSDLLGGKLVALLATSRQVRADFDRCYSHRLTTISGRDPNARLLAITTTSALGRSSIYNRLTLSNGSLLFEPLGYTAGSGDFQFAGPIYEQLHRVATAHAAPTARKESWGGSGFRNRREVVQRAMQALGLSTSVRFHGVERQVFGVRTAHNSLELLRGEHTKPTAWRTVDADLLGEWWLERWGYPRSQRTFDYKAFDPETWRLWR